MSDKSLLEQWRETAYNKELTKNQLETFWGNYFAIEKNIYEKLLEEPDVEVKGTVKELAEKYGVQDALVEQSTEEDATEEETEDVTEAATEAAEDSDVAYIQDKGSLIVGITDFEPMDYKDENGDWIGFDADMAGVVAEKLGVDVEFVEIDWDNKIMELDSKNIDMVWNGMTLTDEVTNSMECTNAYCNNAQVVVVPAE